jgi:hypothetical protein
MQRFFLAVLLVVLLGPSGKTTADEKADALLAKGLKALSGEAAAAKFPAATWKGQGLFHDTPDGKPTAFTGEWVWQSPDKFRAVLTMTDTGIKKVLVLNGETGWVKRDDSTAEELTSEAVAVEQQQLWALTALRTLWPLQDKAVTREVGGEKQFGDQKGVELKATRDGRELRLWLDRDSGLPIQGAWTVRDRTGTEVVQEVRVSDYKEVKGLKRAMKVALSRDGRLVVEMQLTEFEPADMLDENVFALPASSGPRRR